MYLLFFSSFFVKIQKIIAQKLLFNLEWNGMEKLYLNRVALSARRLVSIGALYLDINYL